jgi:hypothetical protein
MQIIRLTTDTTIHREGFPGRKKTVAPVFQAKNKAGRCHFKRRGKLKVPRSSPTVPAEAKSSGVARR